MFVILITQGGLHMRKELLGFILALLLGAPFAGISLISALAGETKPNPYNKYYTCIEVKKGDSLWSIAGEYMENSGMTTAQYVKELKIMNGLKEDTIHCGNYLTIMYFLPASENDKGYCPVSTFTVE